jgi:hypothetical protein
MRFTGLGSGIQSDIVPRGHLVMAEPLGSTPKETSAIPSNPWLVLDLLAVYLVATSMAWLVRSAEWFYSRSLHSWLGILMIEGRFLLSSL